MPRFLRTLISLAFFGALAWAACTVELGRHTFVEHLSRIGDTPEARELIDGTRERVDPLLDEASERVLGEHVEAPTAITREPRPRARVARTRPVREAPRSSPSTADETRLPGQPRGS
ncbi:MAG: hypothetical protein R3A51_15705 [Nannocystaceae bacterium]|nr:hypothetical protein [Myxococcales bacterium]